MRFYRKHIARVRVYVHYDLTNDSRTSVMAAARQVEEALADVFNVSLASSKNVLLTAQDQGVIRKGVRGRQLHYNVTELNNLLLGHTVEPRPEMGARIPKWRETPAVHYYQWMTDRSAKFNVRARARVIGGHANIYLDDYRDSLFPGLSEVVESNSLVPDPHLFQILPGDTFGAALDSFVDYISRPEGRALRGALKMSGWNLQLDSTGAATINLFEEGYRLFSSFRSEDQDLSTPKYVRTHSFSFATIEVLADLWADTKAQTGDEGPDLLTIRSERKKAAGLPPPNGLLITPKQTAPCQCETDPAHRDKFNTHTHSHNNGKSPRFASLETHQRVTRHADSSCSCSA